MNNLVLFFAILMIVFGTFLLFIEDKDLLNLKYTSFFFILLGSYLLTWFFKKQTEEIMEELELELKLNRGTQNAKESVDNNK
ncbi:MAG: hypothetical protein QW607_09735 [Desulfurococcaceae archaeon]